jgi:hypothetical protein
MEYFSGACLKFPFYVSGTEGSYPLPTSHSHDSTIACPAPKIQGKLIRHASSPHRSRISMPTLVKHLSKSQRDELFKNLNYLNTKEYRRFCDKHKIPYAIYIRTAKGLGKTSEQDRKKVVLERIRHYLNTGKIRDCTVFSASVVSRTRLKRFTPSTRLHFGQYEKYNRHFLKVMKSLTNGAFRDGMLARVVIREFWTNGQAPTLKHYAKAWLSSTEGDLKNHPEAAYLTDLAAGLADSDWKKVRVQKAGAALKILDNLASSERKAF